MAVKDFKCLIQSHIQELNSSLGSNPKVLANAVRLGNAIKEVDLACLEADDEHEILSLVLQLIQVPNVSIDLALICGNFYVKLSLLCQDMSVSQLILSDDRCSEFAKLCLLTGCLNHYPDDSLVHPIFNLIIKLCSKHSNHAYQSFQALRLWSAKSKVALNKTERQSLLDLLNANWENPLRGVPDLLTETLANVLDTLNDPAFNEQLLEQTLSTLSWKTKAKYPPLLVILPRVGIASVLNSVQGFGQGLAESLSSNHLASIGASVYRVIVKAKDVLEAWKGQFLRPLLHALCHDESALVRNNAKNHWLNPTLTHLPKEAGLALVENLCECDQCSMVKFLVLRGQRVNGLLDSLDEATLKLVEQGLIHSSCEVSIAAFSVICHVKKRGVAPSIEELKLVSKFIQDHLTVDDPAFRQVLASDFTLLMIRCRDCSVALHRKSPESPIYVATMQCVNDILETLCTNLFPGANYQRLITSLELLAVMNSSFFAFNPTGMNKGSANGDPSRLVSHVQKAHGLMHFRHNHMKNILVSSVLHYMIDVKALAFEMLTSGSFSQFLVEVIPAIFKKAFFLSQSSKFSDCESAAILFTLCIKSSSDNKDWSMVYKSAELPASQLFVPHEEMEGNRLLSRLLLKSYQSLLTECQQNFVRIAKRAPMHGLLTSLRETLVLEKNFLPADFGESLVNCLQESVNVMLNILSGGRSYRNASFAEMGMAVEAILMEDITYNQDVTISDEHSLVLACAWLNLKECCLVASKLYEAPQAVVEKAGQLIITVLTGTRHKGALEAAALALAQFSAALLANYSELPEKWLNEVISGLEVKHSASVTRRSAGLPLLVRSLVSSEQRGSSQGRHLVNVAVKQLLAILERASICEKNADFETEDVPQCHALHILKSLIHDSSLSHDVLPHLPLILRQCVEQFLSPLWPARNAALQLFGSLLPRILGQKKLRIDQELDGLELFNSVTAQELFSRHPELAGFLLQRLNECQVNTDPSLVPILSMLARVSPGLQNIPDPELRSKMDPFKALFVVYLSHYEITVRKLAAKCLISFTPKVLLMRTLSMLHHFIQDNPNAANFVHGCLVSFTYGVRLLKSEFKADFEDNLKALEDNVQAMTSVIITSSCHYNQLILFNLRSEIGLEEVKLIALDLGHHPGSRDLQLVGSHGKKAILNNLKYPPNQEDIKSVMTYLEDNAIEQQLVSAPMLEQMNHYLMQECSDIILDDCEIAMDLLHILSNPIIIEEKVFGSSGASSSIAASSIAFSSMLLKEDYNMFFGGDGSTYVSQFCELADHVVEMSHATNQELIRSHAADFVLNLSQVFHQRVLTASDLSLHMRYGLVQVLNACLILLSDEDTPIRMKAVEFVCKLSQSKVCRVEAMRQVTSIGLNCFEDCAEFFKPISDLTHVDWNFVDNTKSISQLFEAGDGINVYAEEAFENSLYSEVFETWLSTIGRQPTLRLLNCSDIEDKASCYYTDLRRSKKEGFEDFLFGPFASPKGRTQAVKVHNLLRIVSRYPFLVRDVNFTAAHQNLLQELCAELAAKLC